MAKLYVTEFTRLAVDARGNTVAAPQYPAIAQYSMAITGSSTTPAAPNATFSGQTRFIEFHTDAICSIDIGAPSKVNATTGANRVAANETRFVGVNPGDAIAVISNT